ncbi:shikimate kinase [Cohnella pontilimi]|uniref:shikimate kinase n=1 Tax=Cohnella pontilimi TaxID=2564100 RepID=UPI003CCC72B9
MIAAHKSRNLIVVGFMGTGKSTVSKLLSQKLGYTGVDTDEEIERRSGRTIPELFASEGEASFRDWESRVIREVLAGDRQVVATGGGAVLREENRLAMLAAGWVVALTADRDTLIRRVSLSAETGNRPLLAGDAAKRVDELLEARRHAYDFAHVMIDTSRRSPAEIAELLLRWLR